ncbi:MAG: hypothetical protein IT332_13120 [Ardenticatenales bacterium]|nr:hypothetical protein [Ardenticatenales bacterium]
MTTCLRPTLRPTLRLALASTLAATLLTWTSPAASVAASPRLPEGLSLTNATVAPDAAPAPQESTACSKRDLKKTQYLALTHSSGVVVHFLGDIRNRVIDTSHVWVNYSYRGMYDLPVTVGSEITVRHELRLTTEIWMGRVRQVQKQIPVVKFCGGWRVQ